jgi:ATP:cob(I)alamin adenosyltransferase
MGEIDELTSLLGVIKALGSQTLGLKINAIQTDLFKVNSELATKTLFVNERMLNKLKYNCNFLKNIIIMPTNFVIPGGSLISAYLDYARTVARRCERKIVKLHKEHAVENMFLLEWINKLSYYLWLLARKEHENATK